MGGDTFEDYDPIKRNLETQIEVCTTHFVHLATCHIASPRKGQPAKQTPFKLFKNASGFDFPLEKTKKHPGIKGLKAKSPSKPPDL